jgi:hypothetical protein
VDRGLVRTFGGRSLWLVGFALAILVFGAGAIVLVGALVGVAFVVMAPVVLGRHGTRRR